MTDDRKSEASDGYTSEAQRTADPSDESVDLDLPENGGLGLGVKTNEDLIYPIGTGRITR